MFHYTYRITFLCGEHKGCYYLGKHSTKNLNDNYAGSGTYCQRYYLKYGKIEKVTYLKEILAYYDSAKDAFDAERVLIGDLWKTDPFCMNVCEGGSGGNRIDFSKTEGSFKGKQHSNETKRKISQKMRKYRVLQYSLDGELLHIWESAMDASRNTGVKQDTVLKGCNNKLKGKPKHYIWKWEK